MKPLTTAVNNVLKAMKGMEPDAALRLYLGSVADLVSISVDQALADLGDAADEACKSLAQAIRDAAPLFAPVERVMTEAGFPSSADTTIVDSSAEVDAPAAPEPAPAPAPATSKTAKETAPPLNDEAK